MEVQLRANVADIFSAEIIEISVTHSISDAPMLRCRDYSVCLAVFLPRNQGFEYIGPCRSPAHITMMLLITVSHAGVSLSSSVLVLRPSVGTDPPPPHFPHAVDAGGTRLESR